MDIWDEKGGWDKYTDSVSSKMASRENPRKKHVLKPQLKQKGNHQGYSFGFAFLTIKYYRSTKSAV